jgi:hypothetical protein
MARVPARPQILIRVQWWSFSKPPFNNFENLVRLLFYCTLTMIISSQSPSQNIIAGRKDEYISTSRRLKKDTIANEIRTLIAARKGRFLRRVTSEEKLSLGVVGGGEDATDAGTSPTATAAAGGSTKGVDAWAVADEEVVLAKIKQSLRGRSFPRTSASSRLAHCFFFFSWRDLGSFSLLSFAHS